MNRNCPVNMFQCGSGECIDMNKICDTKRDCKDFSDEGHILCNQVKIKSSIDNLKENKTSTLISYTKGLMQIEMI